MKTPKFLKVALAGLIAGQLAWAEPVWPPDSFTCYYGKITQEAVEDLKELDLLVVHPGDEGKNLNAAKIQQLRKAGKEKTIVAYVTVGEDDRPPGGPPILNEDAEGPSFVGKSLTTEKAKNGYASRFLDQRKLLLGDDGFLQFDKHGKPKIAKGQDGHPDENGVWGSYYVRADDPAWRERVFSIMDNLSEIGVDGFFLDTVDTASPWGDYGWTSSAMLDFVKVIRERYPDKRIVANRGLFYLSQNDRYAKLIDAVLFESLLTHYNWENEAGDISPWAKWHVIALNNDVIPAQKRSDMHLLVLDYLNPKQEDALNLVQSDRTLLQNTPHSLSFNHPSLKQAGWTPDELLPESAPASWPSLQDISIEEGEPGELTLEATFSEDIPKAAHPDLRITTRDEIKAEGAAELAPAQVRSWKALGPKLTVKASGLDKNQKYHVFLRLISRSKTPQSAYGWSDYQSASNELPSQIQELSTASVADGVELKFKADSLVAKTYRAYSVKEGQRSLLKEGQSSPILLDHLPVKGVDHVHVVGVAEDGREGYPSLIKTIVRQDVTPPPSPGAVSFSQSDETSTFSWEASSEAKSYRLYVIPKGQDFRLPLLTEETSEEIDNVVPGEYKAFLTAVDESGNQSRPGPSIDIEVN